MIYSILKSVYPNAIPYFYSEEGGHIISKIGNRFYDVDGYAGHDDSEMKPIPLTKEDEIYWDGNASGFRAEWMIKRRSENYKDS